MIHPQSYIPRPAPSPEAIRKAKIQQAAHSVVEQYRQIESERLKDFLAHEFNQHVINYAASELLNVKKILLVGGLTAEQRAAQEQHLIFLEDLIDGRIYRESLEQAVGRYAISVRAKARRCQAVDSPHAGASADRG